jgi:calcium-dependent protein kinase
MTCCNAFSYILSCGLCGSITDPDEEYWGERDPLLDNKFQNPASGDNHGNRGASSSSARLSGQPKPKKPANTSNMLGLGIRDVTSDYELGELVGEGAFGVVRRCKHRQTGQEYACKTVVKNQLKRRADVEDVRREVQILMMLSSHPNVAALLAIYEDDEAVHLILELCEGGQVFDSICAQGFISERSVARLFRKMVEVVQHCHTLGIAHRDIKPENFLLSKSGPDGQVKAADFGLSQFFRPGKSFTSLVGSAYFVAPEVLKRNYGPQADIWSLGVCLYILLSGMTPFWGDTEEDIFKMVLHADINFESHPWPKISKPAKDIVKRMLERDPQKRPTAAQLLQHSWLCQAAPDTPLGEDIVERIRSFAAFTKVKRAAMLLAAQGLEENSAPQISAMMENLEAAEVTEGAGVTADEALRAGVTLTSSGQEQLAQGSRQLLSAPELVAATLGASPAPREELVQCLFKKFDAKGHGSVTQDEIYEVLKTYGISKADVATIVAAVDEDKDGRLNLAEFSVLMARNTDSLQEAVRRRWKDQNSPQKRKLGTVTEEGDVEGDDDWEE